MLLRPGVDSLWRNASGFEVEKHGTNTAALRLVAPGAAFDVTLAQPLRANVKHLLAVALRNGTSAGLARVFWAGAGEAFEPVRSAWIPLVQNDDFLREYHCAIGLEPGWHGTITHLRIEPVTGMTERGIVVFGTIRLLETPSTKNYCHP